MSGEASPSRIWQLGVDSPVVLDAAYDFDRGSRRYIDSQIRGLETHVIQSLLTGTICTWMQLDPGTAAGSVGDVVCLAGSQNYTVTHATSANIASAGSAFGILVSAGPPGALVRVALLGLVPALVTGLPTTGNATFAVVNTATGRVQTTASIGSSDYPLGTVDAYGSLTLAIQLPPVVGGTPSASGVSCIRFPIATAATRASTTSITSNYEALFATVTVTTPYNNGATFQLGNSTSPGLLIPSGKIDLTLAFPSGVTSLIYTFPIDVPWGGSTLPVLASIGNVPTVGAGTVMVQYGVPQS